MQDFGQKNEIFFFKRGLTSFNNIKWRNSKKENAENVELV